MPTEPDKRRPAARWAAFFVILVVICSGAYQALYHPKTPLSNAWNPIQPLRISDPVTALTGWKLTRTLNNGDSCRTTLAEGGISFDRMADLVAGQGCGIADRVRLQSLGHSKLNTLETRCPTALRMAMWEHHTLQPAAARHFGQSIRRVRHLSSYNCRQIRTPQGTGGRLSTHATADAIDIAGFELEDGTKITLQKDWGNGTTAAGFLKDARDGACTWFKVTLGPEYNRLHADHFHLQHTGWGLCR